MTWVPKGNIVGDAGVKSGLCRPSELEKILEGRLRCTGNTKAETGCEKAAIIVYDTHQSLETLVNCNGHV